MRSKIKALGPKNTQILHETLFIPRKYYNLYGLYDLSFPMSADYSWISKAIKSGVSINYTDFVFVDYLQDGVYRQIRKIFSKDIRSFSCYEKRGKFIFAIKRYIIRVIFFCLSRIKYYFIKFYKFK